MARGLGLGLSIVERVARVLIVRSRVESESGRGSHFSVTVPLSNEAPIELLARESARVDPNQLAGITALCVDNEPSVLDGMETLLARMGMRGNQGAGLEFALAAIAERRRAERASGGLPSGDGNGIEAIVALRRRYGDLPAILITADRSPAVREQARARKRPGPAQAAQASGASRVARAMARARVAAE